MKINNIPNLTSEQAADELVLLELEDLIRKARTANRKVDQALQKVFQALNDMCIELESPTDALMQKTQMIYNKRLLVMFIITSIVYMV